MPDYHHGLIEEMGLGLDIDVAVGVAEEGIGDLGLRGNERHEIGFSQVGRRNSPGFADDVRLEKRAESVHVPLPGLAHYRVHDPFESAVEDHGVPADQMVTFAQEWIARDRRELERPAWSLERTFAKATIFGSPYVACRGSNQLSGST